MDKSNKCSASISRRIVSSSIMPILIVKKWMKIKTFYKNTWEKYADVNLENNLQLHKLDKV
jgi:hypothetical protein